MVLEGLAGRTSGAGGASRPDEWCTGRELTLTIQRSLVCACSPGIGHLDQHSRYRLYLREQALLALTATHTASPCMYCVHLEKCAVNW